MHFHHPTIDAPQAAPLQQQASPLAHPTAPQIKLPTHYKPKPPHLLHLNPPRGTKQHPRRNNRVGESIQCQVVTVWPPRYAQGIEGTGLE